MLSRAMPRESTHPQNHSTWRFPKIGLPHLSPICIILFWDFPSQTIHLVVPPFMETPQNFPTTAATPWHLHGSPGRSRWKASCMAVVPRSASENSAVHGGREALQMLQLKMGHLGSLGTQISQSLTCEGVKG